MPIYSEVFTVPANTDKEFSIEVEGDVITYVRIRFPPGPQGLLKVQIFYGLKQIFPWREGTYFFGDDEIIEWDEWWELPESPCRLKIKAVNEDDTYEHSFGLVINVRRKRETMEYKIADRLVQFFKWLFGRRGRW